MRIPASVLLVPALLPLHTHAFAQNAPGYISSLTVNPPVVAPDAPTTTVTVTVTPQNGLPVSSLDGMLVDISSNSGGGNVPLKNGVASAVISLNLFKSIEVFATFPGPGQIGSTPAEAGVFQRYSPLATALDGDYVFSIHSNGGNGAGDGVSIGALTFNEDGSGNKTVTGELDYNGRLGSFQAVPVTGNYTLDGYGRGTITLRSSMGTQHFDLFANPAQLAATSFQATGGITQAALVETDGPLLAGSGTLMARSEGPGLYPLNNLQLDLSGQIEGQTAFPLRVSLTGSINYSASNVPNLTQTASGVVDLASGAYVRQAVPLAVTTLSSDAQNRYTFRLTTANQLSQQPSSFVGYAVNDNRFLLLSTEPVQNTVLLSGQASAP